LKAKLPPQREREFVSSCLYYPFVDSVDSVEGVIISTCYMTICKGCANSEEPRNL